jgi:hypothetical protein
VSLDVLGCSEITADPIRTGGGLSYDYSVLVHDSDDATRGKLIYPQCVLEMLEPGSNGDDGLQSIGSILNCSRDVDDPFSGHSSYMHVSNCEALASKYFAEIWVVGNIYTRTLSVPGCPDVVAIEGKQHDVTKEARRPGLCLSQQRVIGACVVGVSRHREAEPSQKVFKITDVVIDLHRQQAGFMHRARDCCRTVIPLLVPNTDPNESREWNDRNKHQSQ